MSSAMVRRSIGAASSTRNVYASALIAFGAGAILLATVLQPLPASGQVVSEANVAAPSTPVEQRLDGAPANAAELVTVMVELADKPASLVYADSLKASLADLAGRFGDPPKPAQDAAIAAAVVLAKAQVSKIETAQQALLPALTSIAYGGKILFRTKSGTTACRFTRPAASWPGWRRLPRAASHIQTPKYQTAATDIDFPAHVPRGPR
jgi:hypothetical protein